MYRLFILVLALAATSEVLAGDRPSRRPAFGRRPEFRRPAPQRPVIRQRVVVRQPLYLYHRTVPSYRASYPVYNAPAPRYYYSPPRRVVSQSRSVSVGVGFSYYRSSGPSYPVVVTQPIPTSVYAPAAPVVYAAPSYATGDYWVGQYVGGGDYEFKFVGPDGRIYEAEVDNGIVEEIELD